MSAINEYGLSSAEYSRLYNVWKNMIARCYNEDNDRFYTYGARGVEVCRDWRENFHSFAKWAVGNGWRSDLWLERKDVNGQYCPDNCTFVSRVEQMRNKTNNIRVTIEGDERCLAEWCEIFHLPFQRVWARYRSYGYTDPRFLFYPGDLRSLWRCRRD